MYLFYFYHIYFYHTSFWCYNSDIAVEIEIKGLGQPEFNSAFYNFINHVAAVSQKKLFHYVFFVGGNGGGFVCLSVVVNGRKGLCSSDITPSLKPERETCFIPIHT